MRRYSTAIAIGTAVALAVVIVVASSWGQGTQGGHRTTVGPSPASADHPNVAMSPQSGMVDTAAATRSIAALERAHAANPTSVRIVLNLGDAYFAVQRYDDAAASYAQALKMSPEHPRAAVRMAMLWHARGDDDRAIELLESVLSALPDEQEAHYDLALILFSRQEVAAAKESWTRAAQVDPSSAMGRAAQDFVDLLSDGDEEPVAP